jgi:type IV secretion system protein VirD4
MNERLVLGVLFAALTALAALCLARYPSPPIWMRLIAVLTGTLSVHCLRGGGGSSSGATYGSARFLDPRDAASLLRPATRPVPPGSVVLGRHRDQLLMLSPAQARQHGLIVGGSGTGKSYSFFLPNAVLASRTSCVFIDPKAELWRYTSGYHNSRRYAPAEPAESAGFNWIPLCADPRIAELAARAIVESGNAFHTEQAWIDLEAGFLSSLFAHASTLRHPTPLTSYYLFTRQSQETLLAQLRASASAMAREQAEVFSQTAERMRGSIVPVVAARLQFLRDPNVARFTSAVRDAPDFSTLKRTPLSLYWCLREQDMARLSPLTSVFFTLLLEQLAAAEGEVPVLLFLDEFASVGTIPHFDNTIALARGRGVGIWLGLQSLSQLDARYGPANAKTILTNCATKIALSGLDLETAEYFSRTVGQATVRTPRRSWTRRWMDPLPSAIHDSSPEHGRFLLTPDEVRRLPEEQALVVTGNRQPMLVVRYPYAHLPLMAHTESLGEAQADDPGAKSRRRKRARRPQTAAASQH